MSGAGAERDLIAELASLSVVERQRLLSRLSVAQRAELNNRWSRWGHRGQVVDGEDWRVWLMLAGRGFGKTRAGAEWVARYAKENKGARIALVGATRDDVVRVMVKGESGLLNVARFLGPVRWRPTEGVVEFGKGSRAYAYAAEAPEALRGPEHHIAWCDELAKWRRAETTWDNLMMTLRLGEHPQVLVTTTPRAVPLIRRIQKLPDVRVTRGRTRDNAHLPDSFVTDIHAQYAGTTLGRQELEGELLEDVEGALWTRAMIEACRTDEVPVLARVVVGVDPPAGIGCDACGIVAVGLGADARGYVLEDASVAGERPEGWARAVADCAGRHGADRVVAESNQGGRMVESVLRAADATLPVALVHASRGKSARAEPVQMLYAQGRVLHVEAFPALEDELCGLMAGGGYEGPGRSPDRADALVWALAELMLGVRGVAAIRRL